MGTKLLYLANSYTYECTAKVVAIHGDEIALDATIFHPSSGVQMADQGVISWEDQEEEASVEAVDKRDGVIWHTLDCSPPPIGTEVVCTIDWDFRYRMMRTHTALHIVNAVVWKEFRAHIIGGQMFSDKARVDVAVESLNNKDIKCLQDRVNEAVNADYPVSIYAVSREKALSLLHAKVVLPESDEICIIDLVGFDRHPGGGTHVRHTKEVGEVQISKSDTKVRSAKRLEIELKDTKGS